MNLNTLSLVGNAVVRKNLYRTLLINMLPTLQTLDDRKITSDEREKAEQSMPPPPSKDTQSTTIVDAASVRNAPPSLQSGKVAVKLNVLSFDTVFVAADPQPSPTKKASVPPPRNPPTKPPSKKPSPRTVFP
jgi:hypothetical protein